MAEGLVDAIRASGGRVLTRARTNSILVQDGRAAGVTVVSSASSPPSANANANASGKGGGSEVRIVEGGSVISAIGVIETFRQLVPSAQANLAKGEEEGEGEGLEPEGFKNLRGARPRVHLCVGLQGNWLEDLEGTSSYYHHVSA